MFCPTIEHNSVSLKEANLANTSSKDAIKVQNFLQQPKIFDKKQIEHVYIHQFLSHMPAKTVIKKNKKTTPSRYRFDASNLNQT